MEQEGASRTCARHGVTPTEAAQRLRWAQDELAFAEDAGLTREVAAYSIAVDVLAELVQSGDTQTD